MRELSTLGDADAEQEADRSRRRQRATASPSTTRITWPRVAPTARSRAISRARWPITWRTCSDDERADEQGDPGEREHKMVKKLRTFVHRGLDVTWRSAPVTASALDGRTWVTASRSSDWVTPGRPSRRCRTNSPVGRGEHVPGGAGVEASDRGGAEQSTRSATSPTTVNVCARPPMTALIWRRRSSPVFGQLCRCRWRPVRPCGRGPRTSTKAKRRHRGTKANPGWGLRRCGPRVPSLTGDQDGALAGPG